MTTAAASPPDRRDARAVEVALAMGVAVTVGGLAFVGASAGIKASLALTALLTIVVGTVLTPRRQNVLLGGMVLACGLLLHKSFGPIADGVHSGAPSLYVTTVDLMVVVLYVLWAVEGRLARDLVAILRRPIAWAPGVGIVTAGASLVVAADLPLAVAELHRIGWAYLLFLYLAGRIDDRRQVWTVLGALAAFVMLQFVVVVLQWRTGGVLGLSFLGLPTELGERTLDQGTLGRPFGTVIHPVFLGATLGSLALLALSVAIHVQRRWVRRGALGIVLAALVPLVISQTRAAAVAFAIGAVVLASWALLRRYVRWTHIGAVAVGAAVVVALAWPYVTQQLANNFGTDQFQYELESRNELNGTAMSMFQSAPLFGVGLNNFERVMDGHDRYGLIFDHNPVHNLFLLQLAETGVVGLLGLLTVGGALLWVAVQLMRSRDRLHVAVGAGLLAILVFYLAEEQLGFSLRKDVPLVTFWIVAGVATACWHRATPPAPRVERVRSRSRRLPGARGWRRRPRRTGTSLALLAFVVATNAIAVGATPDPLAGARVVFSAQERSSGTWGIYVLEDGETRRVTPVDGRRYDWPSWAFGGQKIIYTAREGPVGSPEQIYMANADGSEERALTDGDWRHSQPHVAPDGRTVVFAASWPEYPHVAIYELDLASGAVRNLSAREEASRGGLDTDPRYTAAGDLVYARSMSDDLTELRTEVWTMGADGTGERRRLVADDHWNVDPSLSPDGSQLAYGSYRGPGTPTIEQLSPEHYVDIALRGVEPTDFVRMEGWQLVVRDLGAGTERALTRGEACQLRSFVDPCELTAGSAFVPTFTPDGGHVLYLSALAQSRVCLCMTSLDGTSAHAVIDTLELGINWYDVAVPGSPPAEAILDPDLLPREDRLLVVEQDGSLLTTPPDRWGGDRIVGLLPAGLRVTSARWSEDGSVAVVSAVGVGPAPPFAPHPAPPVGEDRREHFTLDMLDPLLAVPALDNELADEQVFLLDLDAGTSTALTDAWIEDHLDGILPDDPRGNRDPDLSPDGRSVLVTNVSGTGESFLLRIDRTTGRTTNLTNVTAGAVPVSDSAGRYSPDGDRIAFVSSTPEHSDIHVMAASGEDVAVVTGDDHYDLAPTWTPDGRSLVYVSYRGDDAAPPSTAPAAGTAAGDWALVRVDLDDGAQQVLVVSDALISSPVVSPDGAQVLYVTVGASGQPDLYTVPAGGGAARPLQVTLTSMEVHVDWR